MKDQRVAKSDGAVTWRRAWLENCRESKDAWLNMRRKMRTDVEQARKTNGTVGSKFGLSEIVWILKRASRTAGGNLTRTKKFEIMKEWVINKKWQYEITQKFRMAKMQSKVSSHRHCAEALKIEGDLRAIERHPGITWCTWLNGILLTESCPKERPLSVNAMLTCASPSNDRGKSAKP
jgi:hypothetical protein